MSARVNSALIRQINLARVFHALREHPESSQRDLGRLTEHVVEQRIDLGERMRLAVVVGDVRQILAGNAVPEVAR